MLAVLQSLKSLAASGNETVTLTVPNGTRALGVIVAAEYAAVAGTSGISISAQVSHDGSTWVASNYKFANVAPAAGVAGSTEVLFAFQDDPYKLDANPIELIKLTITNTDATNAVAVAVLTEDQRSLGR